MRFIIQMFFILSLSSCLQSTNSNSFDRSFSEDIGIDRSTASGERLYQAYKVMQENCMSCHSGFHNNWNSFKNDEKWISSDLVDPSDPYSSTLVIRLKNIGGNMPKDNPQISEDEFDKIVDWINGL